MSRGKNISRVSAINRNWSNANCKQSNLVIINNLRDVISLARFYLSLSPSLGPREHSFYRKRPRRWAGNDFAPIRIKDDKISFDDLLLQITHLVESFPADSILDQWMVENKITKRKEKNKN